MCCALVSAHGFACFGSWIKERGLFMSSATTAGLREQCFKLDIWWDGYSAI